MRKRGKKKMPDTAQVSTETDAEVVMTGSGAPEVAAVIACNYPAPVVVNGAAYCGCQLPQDHEGAHEVKVTWQR